MAFMTRSVGKSCIKTEILGPEAEAPLKHYLDNSLETLFISSDNQLLDMNRPLFWAGSLSKVKLLRDFSSFHYGRAV